MLAVLEDQAGSVFSAGLRDHLNKVFLQSSTSHSLPESLRDFAVVETASYWHRPGYAMDDVADRAMSVIFAREAQKTPYSTAEELEFAIAHEALYYMRQQVEETKLPLPGQG